MPWTTSKEQFACTYCAGTGEKFDHLIDDWTYPAVPCDYCKGSGHEYREVDVWLEDDRYARSGEDNPDRGS